MRVEAARAGLDDKMNMPVKWIINILIWVVIGVLVALILYGALKTGGAFKT